MLKLEYNLTLKDEERSFTQYPQTEKGLGELVYIEGENSSGKSTFLHIIAIAFLAHKKESLNPNLKKKLDFLLSDKVELDFVLQVSDPTNSNILISKKEKGSGEIFLEHVNSKKIKSNFSPHMLKSNYNIIYDIPDNPLNRIKELKNEVKVFQQEIGTDIKDAIGYFRNIIREIDDSKNPKLLKQKQDELQRLVKENNHNKAEFDKNKLHVRDVKIYWSLRNLNELTEDIYELNKKIKDLEKTTDKKKKKVVKKGRETNTLIKKARELKIDLETCFKTSKRDVRRLLPLQTTIDKQLITLWEEIDISEEIDPRGMKANQLESVGKSIINLLNKAIVKSKGDKNYDKGIFFEELLNFLYDHINKDLNFPGLNIPLDEFTEQIEKDLKELKAVTQTVNDLNSCVKNIHQLIKDKIELVIDIYPQIMKFGNDGDDDLEDDDVNNILDSIQSSLNEKKEFHNYFKKQLIIMGYDNKEEKSKIHEIALQEKLPNTITSKNDEDLNYYIQDFEKTLNETNRNLSLENNNLKSLVNTITRMENKDEHLYMEYKDEINDYLIRLQTLESLFLHTFKQYFTDLSSNISTNLPPEHNAYYQAIYSYLAKKVGTIRFIDKVEEVDSINTIDETVITTSGKTINFQAMGTGQSQSAYLTGLLNIYDAKPNVILFDEVAMMGEKSLGAIYSKLNEMRKNKKVMFAAVVQRGKEFKIEEK